MIDFKELRQKMIVLKNTVQKVGIESRNMSLVKTNLQLAMMWSGNYLKFSRLGDNPYKGSGEVRKNKEDIEPFFDGTEDYIREVLQGSHIEAIDRLRTVLEKEIEILISYTTSPEEHLKNISNEDIVHTNLCLTNIYKSMSEAKMWMGMELGALRDKAQ